MPTIRSFIAIELSDEGRAALTDLQDRLKGRLPADTVRWTAARNIHLTLHFLGDVDLQDIEKVTDAVQSTTATGRPFLLRLEKLGCFPNTRRPRIVWTGIGGELDPLLKLQANLGKSLSVIDFTPDSRPYSPHLTIGRVKKGLSNALLKRLGQALEREAATVDHLAPLDVTGLSLIKSELKPAGPIYTVLARGSLQH